MRLPGSVVRITLNGADIAPGAPLQATTDPPATVLLTFPFAVDRPSVERWLPQSAAPEWVDDRTLRVTVGDAGGFKLAETLSADGATVIDFVVVNVMFPASHTVEVYSLTDLISGTSSPRPIESRRLRLPANLAAVRRLTGEAVSSDGRLILLYPTATLPPYVIDVNTGASNTVAFSEVEDDGFAFSGWLADGRLLFVGRRVWIGDARGTRVTLVPDAVAPAGARPVAVAPYRAAYAALGYPDGSVVILDLASGATRRLSQRFGPCGAAPSLTWSLDGVLLLGTDCETQDPSSEKLRVVDVVSDRTVKTLDGAGVYRVSTFANGHFLVKAPSRIYGEGTPSFGIEMKLDGTEVRRYTGGGAWTMSPDGRYVLQSDQLGGAASSFAYPWRLIDVSSGAEYRFAIPPGLTQWLADGRLVDVNAFK